MNKDIKEKISQFLDDEIHFSDLDNLLKKIRQQPELKSKMTRYQVVSHALKSDGLLLTNGSFLDNINQELKKEPTHFQPAIVDKKRQLGFWQGASLAVAASIAIVSIVLIQPQNINGKSALGFPGSTALNVAQVLPEKEGKLSNHERLKAYLRAHSDDIYTHGSLNIHPFASVASYGQD